MAAIREALSHQVIDMPFQTSLTLKKVGDLISKLEKTSFSKAEIERLRMPLTLLLERIVFEFKPGKTCPKNSHLYPPFKRSFKNTFL